MDPLGHFSSGETCSNTHGGSKKKNKMESRKASSSSCSPPISFRSPKTRKSPSGMDNQPPCFSVKVGKCDKENVFVGILRCVNLHSCILREQASSVHFFMCTVSMKDLPALRKPQQSNVRKMSPASRVSRGDRGQQWFE